MNIFTIYVFQQIITSYHNSFSLCLYNQRFNGNILFFFFYFSAAPDKRKTLTIGNFHLMALLYSNSVSTNRFKRFFIVLWVYNDLIMLNLLKIVFCGVYNLKLGDMVAELLKKNIQGIKIANLLLIRESLSMLTSSIIVRKPNE